MEIHSNQIDTLRRSRLRSLFSLSWTWSFPIFSLLASWSWPSNFSVTFLMHLFIFWITTHTPTYFASSWWKFSFSDVLRYLTNAWFIWLRKCFHTIFATSISSLKALSKLFGFILLFSIFRMILWIFASEDKILSWASTTSTGLTSLIPEMSSSLVSGYYTYTCFFIFISISMLTFFTTIFISYDPIILFERLHLFSLRLTFLL